MCIDRCAAGKYLVLTSDSGGFNNIRLAFETGIVFAVLTGRTLVLPAKKRWYLLGSTEVIPGSARSHECLTG